MSDVNVFLQELCNYVIVMHDNHFHPEVSIAPWRMRIYGDRVCVIRFKTIWMWLVWWKRVVTYCVMTGPLNDIWCDGLWCGEVYCSSLWSGELSRVALCYGIMWYGEPWSKSVATFLSKALLLLWATFLISSLKELFSATFGYSSLPRANCSYYSFLEGKLYFCLFFSSKNFANSYSWIVAAILAPCLWTSSQSLQCVQTSPIPFPHRTAAQALWVKLAPAALTVSEVPLSWRESLKRLRSAQSWGACLLHGSLWTQSSHSNWDRLSEGHKQLQKQARLNTSTKFKR